MAKLSAHGKEIGRLEFLTTAKAFMEDGTVLKNSGFGWKISGKVKPGFTPAEVFRRSSDRACEFRAARPAYSAYRSALHSMCGLNKRWKLHATVQCMPYDPNGVWSVACDGYRDNIHADIDEVSHLCNLYLDNVREQQEMNEALVAALVAPRFPVTPSTSEPRCYIVPRMEIPRD